MKAKQPLSILLVDDDEDDYLIIRDMLKTALPVPVKLDWIDNFDDAVEKIASNGHQVYMIDYRLGRHNGIELLEKLDLAQRHEPFIVLTGVGDEDVEQQARKIGAADYLVKGAFDAELLRRSIQYSLSRKQMENQRIDHLLELNRSKDEFIALASHQLRTPATAVKQYVGMVLEGYVGDITEEQRAFLKQAYDSNEHQLKVVDDILRVARIDLHQIELKKEKIDLNNLLKSCIAEVKPQIKERSQSLTRESSSDDIVVEGDSAYLGMAIGNLLENASKYTPEDKEITLGCYKLSDDEAAITVADQGVGIAKADQQKLFKKFSRIDNPLSVKAGGTGLGLYWANEIIQQHGGTISVTSAPDEGTTFTITLPLA